MYNQVIVVEGTHDEQKIKSVFPMVDCIVTNGSEISSEILNLIYQTSIKREVILFLDPDCPGKRITDKILETNGNYKIAFLNKEKAISKNRKKVGIEHANEADIRESLQNYFSLIENNSRITMSDLRNRGLLGESGSRNKRTKLCKSLNIPVFNGKALCKYLNVLDIKIERVDDLIER